MVEEWFVLFVHRFPVCPVHLGVIQKIAVNPPSLTVDLLPFSDRVHFCLEISCL